MARARSVRLLIAKAFRYARRIPTAFFKEFIEPIFNSGQILTFSAAVIGLALFLQTASPTDRDAQADSWALSIQAFGIVLIGWALISLIRAPLIVIRDDNRRGRWHGHRFIYHEPFFVSTVRIGDGDGETHTYPIIVEDAEPNSFVYVSVDATPNASNRIRLILAGGPANGAVKIEHPTDNRFVFGANPGAHIGFRLPPNRRATLYVSSLPSTVPIVLRLYCHSLFIGKNDESYEPMG